MFLLLNLRGVTMCQGADDGMSFLKTKYYPVNIEKKIILDRPFDTESDCFDVYRAKMIGLKGERLNAHNCYKDFTILGPDDLRNDIKYAEEV